MAQGCHLGMDGLVLLAQSNSTKKGSVREIEHSRFLPVYCTFYFFWYKVKFYLPKLAHACLAEPLLKSLHTSLKQAHMIFLTKCHNDIHSHPSLVVVTVIDQL